MPSKRIPVSASCWRCTRKNETPGRTAGVLAGRIAGVSPAHPTLIRRLDKIEQTIRVVLKNSSTSWSEGAGSEILTSDVRIPEVGFRFERLTGPAEILHNILGPT